MSHVKYAVQSFLAGVTMCVVSVAHTIMLIFYFLALIEFAAGIINFNSSCQSCLPNLKTIYYGSANFSCPYNVPENFNSMQTVNNKTWKVFCRSQDYVSFEKIKTSTGCYLFGIREGNKYRTLTLTNQTHLIVQNLTASTSYDFLFAEVQSTDEKLSVQHLSEKTLPNPEFEANPVNGIEILDWIPSRKTVSAKIRWIPGPWNSCDFDFIWQSETEIYKKEVRQVQDSNEIVLDKMMYDSNYTLIVLSILNGAEYAESPPATFIINTPLCVQINPPNTCPPEKLENVFVEEVLVENGIDSQPAFYNVSLRWKTPVHEPLTVIVDLKTEHANESYHLQKTVPGNETSVVFSRIALGSLFKIRAWAVSAGGPGPVVKIMCVTAPAGSTDDAGSIMLTQISYLSCGLLFLFAVALFIYYSKGAKVQEPAVSNDSLKIGLSVLQPVLFENSRYEVSRDSIILHGVLGEGAFGIVRKGCLQLGGQRRDIAVKMLKMKPSDEEKEQLLQELEILHTIGQHDHVVSLVACCTICCIEDMLIVVEYCAQGDLQKYLQMAEYSGLRKNRSMPDSASSDEEFKFSPGDSIHAEECTRIEDGVINHLYDALIDISAPAGIKRVKLSIYDLVSFSRQVADGMAFLAANRIIHRDLAARNVLVTDERTVKISDFGLSRDIYLNDNYIKTSNGKIPVKWMAIESLVHQKYTSQSDVWSFGILLWEIMTFGSIPYEGIQPMHLKELLTGGYRLPCPEITPSELYSVMLSCWQLEQYCRPNFNELKTTLDSILAKLGLKITYQNNILPV